MTDLTTNEAAEKLKVSVRTIRNWIEGKLLNGYKLNPNAKSVYRIPEKEIDRLLRLRTPPNKRKAN